MLYSLGRKGDVMNNVSTILPVETATYDVPKRWYACQHERSVVISDTETDKVLHVFEPPKDWENWGWNLTKSGVVFTRKA